MLLGINHPCTPDLAPLDCIISCKWLGCQFEDCKEIALNISLPTEYYGNLFNSWVYTKSHHECIENACVLHAGVKVCCMSMVYLHHWSV
jgi:hypothetical protein